MDKTVEYCPMFISLKQSMEYLCALGGFALTAKLGLTRSNHEYMEDSIMWGEKLIAKEMYRN